MKKRALLLTVLCGFLLPHLHAQEINITAIHKNGEISWEGCQLGTTARVEWASSLVDTGGTNWHSFTNVVVINSTNMTQKIPMFFRVVGTPVTTLAINDMPSEFLGNWYDTVKGHREWRFGISLSALRTANVDWTYESIQYLGAETYDFVIEHNGDQRYYKFRNITASTMEYAGIDGIWITATR